MCGICGIVSFDKRIENTTIKRMASVLAHRGPDDEGYFIKNQYISPTKNVNVALGHRRLKIIDLSEAANQPISNEDGNIKLVFNGEIYNFRTLRKELRAKGHIFKSRSDSEVIIHAYEEYGVDCLKELDGMFAFAIWDEKIKRLFLGRDRVGKKPLYYYFDNSYFLFASEIKSILQSRLVKSTICVEAIPLYFTYGYVPSPMTFYNGIFQILPASYLVVDKYGMKEQISYWDIEFPAKGEELKISEEEASREITRLLCSAVEKRLVTDVPLGAFLSGGIDSSIVVGLMSQQIDEPVKTFSIGFTGEESYDETRYAKIVAEHFKTDHIEFKVKPSALDLVEKLLWHHDQPYGDSSAIPTYILSELTKQHVTVALSGDGGDEIFAGYERFLAALLAEKIPKLLSSFSPIVLQLLSDNDNFYSIRRRLKRFIEHFSKSLPERYSGWSSYFNNEMIKNILNDDLKYLLAKVDIQQSYDVCFSKTENCDILNQLMYLNYKTYLPDDLLVKMDRMSMASGLEVRSPFLDTELIEFVAKLKPSLKIKMGKMKYILRKSFSDFLPKPILKRKKHGFGAPVGYWFRNDLKKYIYDILMSSSSVYKDYLNQNFIKKILEEHQCGKNDYGRQLWSVLNFELWLRKL